MLLDIFNSPCKGLRLSFGTSLVLLRSVLYLCFIFLEICEGVSSVHILLYHISDLNSPLLLFHPPQSLDLVHSLELIRLSPPPSHILFGPLVSSTAKTGQPKKRQIKYERSGWSDDLPSKKQRDKAEVVAHSFPVLGTRYQSSMVISQYRTPSTHVFDGNLLGAQ